MRSRESFRGRLLTGLIVVTLGTGAAPDCPVGAAETVIDDGDPGFSQQGLERATDATAHGGDMWVGRQPSAQAFARYAPGLTGTYDVYLYWGDFPDMEPDAHWAVKHRGGTVLRAFNQRRNPGWHFHGSYHLAPDSLVELRAAKFDAPVVADAVKFVPAVRRVIARTAKDTLTPVTLNRDDELHFTLRDGQVREVRLLSTAAAVVDRDPRDPGRIRKYTFQAVLQIDGQQRRIERVIPAQESFYEPLEIRGLRLWLDAVTDVFVDDGGFLVEKDDAYGLTCRPTRQARIVVNDVHDRICPEPLAWWYPEQNEHLDVRRCYRGEDVWMGPYDGKAAHGGLDINMPSGTPLFAPLGFDDQYLFDALVRKDNNNRWRGIRRWPDGAVWWLQAHHLNRLLVPEHTPLARGTRYAETAGVHAGAAHHTHFVFRVFEEGEAHFLDPWILFWQMFRDHRTGAARKPAP